MKGFINLMLALVLAACSHQAKKVDCDRHLEAINPPNPVVKVDATSAPKP